MRFRIDLTLTVDATPNPITLIRCLRDAHDDCRMSDHIQLLSVEYDVSQLDDDD